MPNLSALKTYDFKQGNILVIGGVEVGGYDEDGSITYEFPSELYERKNGADGQTTVSRLNDDDVLCTVTLLESSPAYKQLALLMNFQLNQNPIIPLPFVHVDINNGDEIVSAYTVFMTRPTPTKGRTVGTREFQVLLPNVARDIGFGTLNLF